MLVVEYELSGRKMEVVIFLCYYELSAVIFLFYYRLSAVRDLYMACTFIYIIVDLCCL